MSHGCGTLYIESENGFGVDNINITFNDTCGLCDDLQDCINTTMWQLSCDNNTVSVQLFDGENAGYNNSIQGCGYNQLVSAIESIEANYNFTPIDYGYNNDNNDDSSSEDDSTVIIISGGVDPTVNWECNHYNQYSLPICVKDYPNSHYADCDGDDALSITTYYDSIDCSGSSTDENTESLSGTYSSCDYSVPCDYYYIDLYNNSDCSVDSESDIMLTWTFVMNECLEFDNFSYIYTCDSSDGTVTFTYYEGCGDCSTDCISQSVNTTSLATWLESEGIDSDQFCVDVCNDIYGYVLFVYIVYFDKSSASCVLFELYSGYVKSMMVLQKKVKVMKQLVNRGPQE